jgi:hypothetical protein
MRCYPPCGSAGFRSRSSDRAFHSRLATRIPSSTPPTAHARNGVRAGQTMRSMVRVRPRSPPELLFTPYAIRDMRYAICDTRYAIRDMRYAICDTRYAIRDTRYAICDTRYAIRDMRYATLPRSHRRRTHAPPLAGASSHCPMVAAILHLARKDLIQHHQAARLGVFSPHCAVSMAVIRSITSASARLAR